MRGSEYGEPTEFGRWLMAAMRDHEPPLDRAKLAARTGISASTISRWILKPGKPDTRRLAALAAALDRDYGEVLARAGHGRPADSIESEPAITDPLARELDQMLHPNSPLSDEDRERIRIIVGAGIDGWRAKMRRRRAS